MHEIKDTHTHTHTTQKTQYGNSLALQWVGLHASTAEGPGSIPGWGTKILQAKPCSMVKTKTNQNNPIRWQRKTVTLHRNTSKFMDSLNSIQGPLGLGGPPRREPLGISKFLLSRESVIHPTLETYPSSCSSFCGPFLFPPQGLCTRYAHCSGYSPHTGPL